MVFMNTSKISIIIPVYNAEQYLERCINSIVNQTFRNYECLMIDDCSTDKSLKMCKNIAKQDIRFKVYHKEKNEGIAKARKTGIEHANSDYVIFIDNDDWIEPQMLEELYNKAVDGNYDMVYCDFYLETLDKTTIFKQPPVESKYSFMKQVLSWDGFVPVTWNKLIKTELYKKIDFIAVNFSEDRLIMFQILYFCKNIAYINKSLYHWCHNPKSTMRDQKNVKKNLFDDYITYVGILLFIYKNSINLKEFLQDILNHIKHMRSSPKWCLYVTFFDEYEKSMLNISDYINKESINDKKILGELIIMKICINDPVKLMGIGYFDNFQIYI